MTSLIDRLQVQRFTDTAGFRMIPYVVGQTPQLEARKLQIAGVFKFRLVEMDETRDPRHRTDKMIIYLIILAGKVPQEDLDLRIRVILFDRSTGYSNVWVACGQWSVPQYGVGRSVRAGKQSYLCLLMLLVFGRNGKGLGLVSFQLKRYVGDCRTE